MWYVYFVQQSLALTYLCRIYGMQEVGQLLLSEHYSVFLALAFHMDCQIKQHRFLFCLFYSAKVANAVLTPKINDIYPNIFRHDSSNAATYRTFEWLVEESDSKPR